MPSERSDAIPTAGMGGDAAVGMRFHRDCFAFVVPALEGDELVAFIEAVQNLKVNSR